MARHETVVVVVCTSLSDDLLQRIAEVDERVHVLDGAAQLLEEVRLALRPGQQPPQMRSPGRSLDELLAETEVILAARRMPTSLAARAPRLRWVQFPMAGVDALRESDVWSSSRIAVTSASGINARPVAEYVMTATLALVKGIRRMTESQREGRWDRFVMGQLRGRTMGIVGLGSVGSEVARLAEVFGMRVLATKRHIDPNGETPDWVLPHAELPRLLQASDVVVLAVPATPETARMIGGRELAMMRKTAYLVNVARGDVIDEAALIKALQAGKLAGAALDVLESEPLPPESPLWAMENVLVSPHIAGLHDDYDARLVDLFTANLRHYLEGHRLINEVDRHEGY